MFDDLYYSTSQQMSVFSDTVRDQFGQSMISDVFEPIQQEINGLQQLDDHLQNTFREVDSLFAELRSIGSTANG